MIEFVTTGSEREERLRAADLLRAAPLLRVPAPFRVVPLRVDFFFRALFFFRAVFFFTAIPPLRLASCAVYRTRSPMLSRALQ